jgi:hypothetical protein
LRLVTLNKKPISKLEETMSLYFIKGDSSENWGAMKLTLKKGGNATAVIEHAEKDGWKAVTAKAFNAWRKKYGK